MQATTVQKEENKDDTAKKQEEKPEYIDLPGSNIQKILVADAMLQKNRIQNNVNTQKENRENVLETEIKMNELHGNNSTAKKEELSSLRKKITFDIEALNAPKSHSSSGMNPNAKVIIVE